MTTPILTFDTRGGIITPGKFYNAAASNHPWVALHLLHPVSKAFEMMYVLDAWMTGAAVDNFWTPHRYQVGDRLRCKPHMREHDHIRHGSVFAEDFHRPLRDGAVMVLDNIFKRASYPFACWETHWESAQPESAWKANEDSLDIWCEHVPAKSRQPTNTTCYCGSPALQLFSTLECRSPTCRLYVPRG